MAEQGQDDRLGALWRKSSERGEFFTGKIRVAGGEEINIVCFPNRHKADGDNKPDYDILRARPRPSR